LDDALETYEAGKLNSLLFFNNLNKIVLYMIVKDELFGDNLMLAETTYP
jgi:hypothetical protein